MQKCTEPLHNHHDGCPACTILKTESDNILAINKFLKTKNDLLNERILKYRNLYNNQLNRLNKKNNQIANLKKEIADMESYIAGQD